MQAPGLWEWILNHLKQPEYLHVALEPMLGVGLTLSAMALALAIALRSRRAQITALALVLITSATAWPVKYYGELGYDRVETQNSVAGNHWMDAHAQRATRFIWVFYVVAGAAAASLIVPWKFPKSALYFNLTTLLCAVVALGFSIWIASAGGQVRHKEFRYGDPPEKVGGYEEMK